MTTSHGGLALAPGTTFCPKDRDLTDLYLRSKIAGKDLPGATARFIHVGNVYCAEPEKLSQAFDEAPGAEPVWYFFSPARYVGGRKRNARGGAGRKSRTIDGGEAGEKRWWHSERGETPVKGGSEYGGCEQYFSYKVKNASTGKEERAGWIMTEYGISPEHGGGDLVLCKIHRSPHVPAASEQAVMTASVPASDPIVKNSKKRNAPAGDHQSEQHAAGVTDHQSTDHAAPPSISFQNMDHNDVVWAQLVTWVDAGAGEVIYGLPCPAFPHDAEVQQRRDHAVAVNSIDANEAMTFDMY